MHAADRAAGVRLGYEAGANIERRPRGASRAALAPTFVSGQSFLCHLRANTLAHGAISRRTSKAVARTCNRRYWPKTNVGASAARDAPRGRRSIFAPPAPQGEPQQPSNSESSYTLCSGGIGQWHLFSLPWRQTVRWRLPCSGRFQAPQQCQLAPRQYFVSRVVRTTYVYFCMEPKMRGWNCPHH